MNCTECGKTFTMEDNEATLQVGCAVTNAAYYCPHCGRLHWSDGEPVFNRSNQKAFIDLKTNKIVNRA